MKEKTIWDDWIGKKVFIILNSRRKYTGIVKEVSNRDGVYWFIFEDKFGSMVSFREGEIDVIEEIKEEQ